jgi:hypothetical protein
MHVQVLRQAVQHSPVLGGVLPQHACGSGIIISVLYRIVLANKHGTALKIGECELQWLKPPLSPASLKHFFLETAVSSTEPSSMSWTNEQLHR